MTYNKKMAKWLQKGIKNGWITEPVCYTHEGPELTEDEQIEFDEGYDPCLPIMRLWID